MFDESDHYHLYCNLVSAMPMINEIREINISDWKRVKWDESAEQNVKQKFLNDPIVQVN